MSHPNDAFFAQASEDFNAHIRVCADVRTPRDEDEWWRICKHENRFLDDMAAAYAPVREG